MLFADTRNVCHMYCRPTTLRLEDFARGVAAAEFHDCPITEKRNGFHIVCTRSEDGRVCYATKKGYPLTYAGAGGLAKTLSMMETHLRDTMRDMFDPAGVLFDPEGISSRPEEDGLDKRSCTAVHLEFCVRLKGDDHDDLCALMHGKWATNPTAYTVHAVAFDIELSSHANGKTRGGLPFWTRFGMMTENFPDPHVVRALYGANEVITALETIEGIVAYDTEGRPRKIKAPHPIPMKILAICKGGSEFIGYTKFMVGVPETEGGARYRIVHEMDMTDLFADRYRAFDGKCFLHADIFALHAKTGKTTVASGSPVAVMVGRLNDAVMQAKRVDSVYTSPRKVALSNGKFLIIDDNRSFTFGPGCEFVDMDVVMSPNEVWRLKNGAIHLQAPSMLAVEGYGIPEHRILLGKPFPLPDLGRVADGRLCQKPAALDTLVYGCPQDVFRQLRHAFRTTATKTRNFHDFTDAAKRARR